MLIFALDDERIILEDTRDVIAAAAPEAEIMLFTRAVPSLEAIREKGLRPDIVFCDIEMPGLSGLQYAAELKKASPETRIVFVTAYPQYAMDAFKVRAQGYILKPLTVAQVEEELSYLPKPPVKNPEKLEVRCFGSFEVMWKGRPLVFSRSRTKELFAYLVDREGGWCTGGEIISNLWEDGDSDKKKYLRVLGSDLISTLKEIGMEKVLLRMRDQWAVDTELLDCDYYRMLQGDMDAVNSYQGEYMKQYSWAELTVGRLFFRNR